MEDWIRAELRASEAGVGRGGSPGIPRGGNSPSAEAPWAKAGIQRPVVSLGAPRAKFVQGGPPWVGYCALASITRKARPDYPPWAKSPHGDDQGGGVFQRGVPLGTWGPINGYPKESGGPP